MLAMLRKKSVLVPILAPKTSETNAHRPTVTSIKTGNCTLIGSSANV